MKNLRKYKFCKNRNIVLTFFFSIMLSLSLSAEKKINFQLASVQSDLVKVGVDRLFNEFSHLIEGKKIALVSNHTARLKNGTHLADTLFNYPHAELVALFGMHFNVRTNDYSLPKDKEIDIDLETGLPKYSLYDEIHKPTHEMLDGVEVIIFDIQEVGARFYEHVNILGFVMEAAAENNIDVIVLDRPNPISGIATDGFITDEKFLFTFGAFGKIPVIHGMTVGEIAKLYNGEGMLKEGVKARLTVIPMLNWKRAMWLDETGLKWIKPSPNLPTLDAILAYTGTCLFEGLNLSAGRGTEKPFQYIGAPWVKNSETVSLLNSIGLSGVEFKEIEFTPEKMDFHSRDPYLSGQVCNGIFVKITNRKLFEPYKVGVAMVWAINKVHPNLMEWNETTMDRLVSTKKLEHMIYSNATPLEIFSSWEHELSMFEEIRKKYLLY